MILSLAALAVLGVGCSSAGDVTPQVRGAVVTNEDPNRGGPSAAVEAFRAGERAAYGTGSPTGP